jgi:hypothetical protein
MLAFKMYDNEVLIRYIIILASQIYFDYISKIILFVNIYNIVSKSIHGTGRYNMNTESTSSKER